MYSKIRTAVNWGIDGYAVEIETNILRGLPNHIIVGLPSTIIKESKERVKSALKSINFKFPDDRIIQNLYPANIKKEGSQLDLPIAMGIVCCLNETLNERMAEYGFLGELSLDGKIQAVSGILSLIDGMAREGIHKIIIPRGNFDEAKYLESVEIFPYDHMNQLLCDFEQLTLVRGLENDEKQNGAYDFNVDFNVDFSEVIGQHDAIRAIEIAVAGFHNVLIIGPPGCGKSMIAERLVTILPEMTLKEKIDVTKIYSISEGERLNGLIHQRPIRSPHHTISRIGLVGGGTHILPGEISKAHNGILYLDEIGEFKTDAIESLREPLSSKSIHLTKSGKSLIYPADFMLVATMNPCPCGNYLSKQEQCTCSHQEIKRYMGKLSWPILDRMDMTLYMERVEDLESIVNYGKNVISSCVLREKIQKTHRFRQQREHQAGLKVNRETVSKTHINHHAHNIDASISEDAQKTFAKLYDKYRMSMRSFGKLKAISRTIADLDEHLLVEKHHVLEAFKYHTATQIKRFYE